MENAIRSSWRGRRQVQGRDGSWPEDSLMNDRSQAHMFKLWTGSFRVWTVCFPVCRWDHGGMRIWGHVSCKCWQPLPCFSLRKESQEDEETHHMHCCNTLVSGFTIVCGHASVTLCLPVSPRRKDCVTAPNSTWPTECPPALERDHDSHFPALPPSSHIPPADRCPGTWLSTCY